MTGKAFAISTFAGWADMDANAHMGNFAYLNKCVDARMGFFAQHGFPVTEFATRRIGPVVRRDELEYQTINCCESPSCTCFAETWAISCAITTASSSSLDASRSTPV
jgi:hypothetical protein